MADLGPCSTVVATRRSFMRNAALLGLTLAAVDYVSCSAAAAKSMMMSKQEIKDEARQSEGDPMVKGQIGRPSGA